MSKIKGKKGKVKTGKIIFIVALLLAIFLIATKIPTASDIDFSKIRDKLASRKSTGSTKRAEAQGVPLDSKETIEQQEQRREYLSNERAKAYLEVAIKDYHLGNYKDALMRLERAKTHDPGNYSIFKLSGQIFFEKNMLKKAFNDWERGAQLPHEDRTILRNLDIVKRLIRHTRNEIDRLQRSVHKDPGDLIAHARLRELEDQMRD